MKHDVIILAEQSPGHYERVIDPELPRPVPCLRCPHAELDYPIERREPFTNRLVGYRKPFQGETTTIWCQTGHLPYGVSLKAAQAFGSPWGWQIRENIAACPLGRQLKALIPLTEGRLVAGA